MQPIKDLLLSKRFIITTMATIALTALCATGKISVEDFSTKLTWLAGILTTMYGLENMSAAHGTSFPEPVANTTVVKSN